MLRQLIKSWLLKNNMIISRPPGQFSILNVKLNNAKRRGLDLKCAVDGGAADGGWTRDFRAIFPNAAVLCVEPRDDVQAMLAAMKSELGNIQIAQTLLGEQEGDVEFHDSGPQSSALPNSLGKSFGVSKRMRTSTLDALVAEHKLPWPDLIKLDLQGFELTALRGASESMKHAQCLLLELSLYEFQKGCPLADEVICFLRDHRYRIYDISNISHRPLDGALGQMDVLFVRDGHPLFADNRYSANSDFS